MKFKIAPSLLAANCAKLGEETREVAAAGADWIHLDVMDQHYVPNLTFGPMVCKALLPYAGKIPLDVHLMTTPVDPMITAFAGAGASFISFHPEATLHVNRSLSLIKEAGLKAGLALNPGTPVASVRDVLDELDYILLMAVNPGFGGQSFIPHTLAKIKEAKALTAAYQEKTGRAILLEVDGGINQDNIRAAATAGADIFVVGSAVFSRPNRGDAIAALKKQLEFPLKEEKND